MTDTFDRTQLDGKDRGQLSEIAAALGVKAVSRMRKAELVDAIVSAAKGRARAGTQGQRQRRGDRTAAQDPIDRRRAADDLAALADEENALGGTNDAAATTW